MPQTRIPIDTQCTFCFGNGALAVLIAIPALFLLFAWLGAASRLGLRHGFVVATVAYTAGVVVATEALSLPGWLRLPGVLAFWTAATLLAFWCWWRGDARARRNALRTGARGLSDAWAVGRLELCGIAIVLGMVLLTGILSPPNNWESMAYRMMRVVMWMQQGSVDHYATPYLPQLYHPPLVSFHILHLQILAGSDRFANVPEWLALAGCGVAASLIAKELKGGLPAQIAAAVLAVTLPMGVMQGSSTQGNLLAAYWLLCFVLLVVWHLRTPALWRLACCGCAAGFAVLAKPTTYVVLPPVAAALGLYGLAVRPPARRTIVLRLPALMGAYWRDVRGPAGRAVVVLGTAALIAVVINLGHYARNWEVFGDAVSPSYVSFDQINKRFDLTILTSNLLRNSLVHWALPSAEANAAMLNTITTVIGAIPEPEAATAGRTLAAGGLSGRFNEMYAPNMLHYWLLAFAVVGLCAGLLVKRWRPDSPPLAGYLAGGWIAAVVAFSAVLQWQEWNSRYHVMLFMLGAPLAAVFLSHLPAYFRRDVPKDGTMSVGVDRPLRVLCGVFLLATTPWLLLKESSPWIRLGDHAGEPLPGANRTAAYFKSIGGGYDGFTTLANKVAELRPTQVGLAVAQNLQGVEYSYPLHVLFGERVGRIAYYDLAWHSPTLPLEGEPPAVVVKTGEHRWEREIRFNDGAALLGGRAYRRVWTHPSRPVSVWRRISTPLLPLSVRELRQRWSREVEAAVCKAALGVDGPGAAVVGDLLLYIAARRPGADGLRASAARLHVAGKTRPIQGRPAAPSVGQVTVASLAPLNELRGFLWASRPWLWERSGGGTWTVVDAPERPHRRYMPTAADTGFRLRATNTVLCGGQDWHLTTDPSAAVAGRANGAGLEGSLAGSPKEQVTTVVLEGAPRENDAAGAGRYKLVIPWGNRLAKHSILAVAIARNRLTTLRLSDVADNGRVVWEHEFALHAPANLPDDDA